MIQNNYTYLINLETGIAFLKSIYGNDAQVQVTDGLRGNQTSVGFSFRIASKELGWAVTDGNITFNQYDCRISLRKNYSQEFETTDYQKPYAIFIYHLIKGQNKNGITTFTCDGFERDYTKHLEQIEKAKIYAAEKECFDNILTYKDKHPNLEDESEIDK